MNRNDRFVWPQAIGRKPLVATHRPQTTREHIHTRTRKTKVMKLSTVSCPHDRGFPPLFVGNDRQVTSTSALISCTKAGLW